MRKSSCFLITKKPLLLDGRKSHYFWMIIPTSSGNRESGLFFLATGPKKPLYTPVTGLHSFFMKTIISLVLLLELAVSAELCTSDVYDSYLEAFPMKCGSDCDEYKRWTVIKEK